METGISENSAQQELHKLPQHAHRAHREDPSATPPTLVRCTLGGGRVSSAPKNSINLDKNNINGLKFHKRLKQSVSFGV